MLSNFQQSRTIQNTLKWKYEIWVAHQAHLSLRAPAQAIRAPNWYILCLDRHIKLGRQASPFFQDFCMKLQICSLLPLSAYAWNTAADSFKSWRRSFTFGRLSTWTTWTTWTTPICKSLSLNLYFLLCICTNLLSLYRYNITCALVTFILSLTEEGRTFIQVHLRNPCFDPFSMTSLSLTLYVYKCALEENKFPECHACAFAKSSVWSPPFVPPFIWLIWFPEKRYNCWDTNIHTYSLKNKIALDIVVALPYKLFSLLALVMLLILISLLILFNTGCTAYIRLMCL